MRKAIAILLTCSTATSTVARKRGSKDDEHGSGDKRPRMESAGADVGVSSKAKKAASKSCNLNVSLTSCRSKLHASVFAIGFFLLLSPYSDIDASPYAYIGNCWI